MAQRESRKHRLGDGSSVGAPPSKREHRTGLKRPLPEDQEDNGSDMEESSSEMDLTQMQTQDEKETDLSMTLVKCLGYSKFLFIFPSQAAVMLCQPRGAPREACGLLCNPFLWIKSD